MTSVNWRIIHTHDTQEHWEQCSGFVPRLGELIIYDADDIHMYERFKIGDGVTTVNQLPFTTERIIESIFNIQDKVIYADGGRITDYENTIT